MCGWAVDGGWDDLGRHDQAIAAYRRAIELDAQYTTPWIGLGLVHTLQGNLEEALKAFRQAVELTPNKGSYRASLAGLLRRLEGGGSPT